MNTQVTQTTVQDQNAIQVADMLKRLIENQRREPKSMDAVPVPGAMMDYAQAGMCVQLAMQHLDEALPTGQKVRAELSLALLLMGAAMLSDWMELKGYKVSWMPDTDKALEAATSEVGALDVVVPIAAHRVLVKDRFGGECYEDSILEEPWVRDSEIVFTTLLLVGGHDVPRNAVDEWSDAQARDAQEWALRAHYAASDNDVNPMYMPEWVKQHPTTGGVL